MAKCKHQSTDGKRCLRPEALLPMCWVYYEYPARREQCKHFEKMVDAKELLEKIDRALMHAQDLLADSLDRHGERDHVAIQKDILAAICAHAVLETRLVENREEE